MPLPDVSPPEWTRAKLLIPMLNNLTHEESDPDLKLALAQISLDLQNGKRLSDAMAQFPYLFDQTYLTVIRQGERAGKLEDALRILGW